ncbi:DUF298-domain-containing protein [Ascobolus immersus RN42]|uniref:Defective in cullin neddylation protein n=1 Tax=Ascobolus immersus RN42 TaxID=1160509 RepID=A0A3N4HLP2_ASCIM|nr:DUF298-domain-containing protein [Ascobolus immersus RN42]
MAYTSAQKSAISQLVQFTGCDERSAVKYLKATNWKVDVAADAYFTGGGVPAAAPASSASSGGSVSGNLNKLFDKYQDPDNKTLMDINGVMTYFMTDLSLNLDEDPIVFAVSELVQAKSMNGFNRAGFVAGWSAVGADTIPKQQSHIAALRRKFESDPAYFKRVYLYTYTFFTPDSKSLPLPEAVSTWQCIFPANSHFRKNYLAHWVEFLQTEYKKSISRDTWTQLLEFAGWLEGEGEGGVAGYDEFGAWPSIIDSFVEYLKPKQNRGEDDTWMD